MRDDLDVLVRLLPVNPHGRGGQRLVRCERQTQGIVKGKRGGAYKIGQAQVKRLAKDGAGPSVIAKELGVSRRQIYRILEEKARVAATTGRRASSLHAIRLHPRTPGSR